MRGSIYYFLGAVVGVALVLLPGCSGGCRAWLFPETDKAITEQHQSAQLERQVQALERIAAALERKAGEERR